MSKTPFRMPQRDAMPTAKLDRWVSGAAEEYNRRENTTARAPGGEIARLTIHLPAELHARFKATCALKGTRVIDEVRQFIDEWTQKNS